MGGFGLSANFCKTACWALVGFCTGLPNNLAFAMFRATTDDFAGNPNLCLMSLFQFSALKSSANLCNKLVSITVGFGVAGFVGAPDRAPGDLLVLAGVWERTGSDVAGLPGKVAPDRPYAMSRKL